MHYTCLFLASKIKTVKRIQTYFSSHDFGSMGTQYTFFGEHGFFCDNKVYHENFDNQIRALCVPPGGITRIQHPELIGLKNVCHNPPTVSSLHKETLQHDIYSKGVYLFYTKFRFRKYFLQILCKFSLKHINRKIVWA